MDRTFAGDRTRDAAVASAPDARPGKQALTDGLPTAAAPTARDRVRDLVGELRARAIRLELAIPARDFESADEAASLVVGEVLSDLMTFLTTGEVPKYLAAEVDAIAATLAEQVKEIRLHGRSGITVVGGAHLSAGAKGRLDYSAGGFLTVDKDLLRMLDGLAAGEVAELLRDKLSDAADLLFPADESDPLPAR